jgi:hypothetical protein
MKRYQKDSSFFKTKIEKRLDIDNSKDFPSLSRVLQPLKNEEDKEIQLNYINASLKVKEETEEKYLPNWLYMSMDKDRKVVKKCNGKIYEKIVVNDKDIESLNKTEFNNKVVGVFSEMIERWENYKNWYVDLYGLDCYQKMYEMVYREDENYDECGDENDDLSQEQLYSSDMDEYDCE